MECRLGMYDAKYVDFVNQSSDHPFSVRGETRYVPIADDHWLLPDFGGYRTAWDLW